MKSKMLIIQLCIAFFAVLLFLFLYGINASISAGLGALVAIMPSMFFSLLYFKKVIGHNAKQIIQHFYLAEFIKLMLTIILFVIVFQWKNLLVVPFFITFVSLLLSYWIILLIP